MQMNIKPTFQKTGFHMCVIGFFRTKKIIILLYAIVFIATVHLGCALFDKDINCRANLSLKVINRTTSAKRIEFLNFKESYNPDFVKITFSDSSASIGQQESRTFLFEYSWIGNSECFFSDAFFEDYRIDVNVKDRDSVFVQYQVYPFDTTKVFQSICTDCVHEYLDSLILK